METPADAIHIRGARQNNLKNLTLSIPNGELVVVGDFKKWARKQGEVAAPHTWLLFRQHG